MNKDINAIGIVRQMIADGQVSQEVAEKYFPELKESEDERIRKSLIGHLKECRNNTRSEVMLGEYAKWIAWLEKQGEQKPALREEDAEMIDYVASILYSNFNENEKFDNNKPCVGALVDWLKSLKDRVQPQPKQEWSETDNELADDAIACVERCYEKYKDNKEFYSSLRHNTIDIKRWIINVKERLTHQWKPSDEQMFDLKCAADSNTNVLLGQSLLSLYNDLKKL